MISDVKPYARARMSALSYTEWSDGFEYTNIPKTLYESNYHLQLGQAGGVSNNQDNLSVLVPLTVRLPLNGANDPKTKIDEAVSRGDAILAEFIAPLNRLTQDTIKDVRFRSMSVEPWGNANDNSLLLTVEFEFFVIICGR